MSPEVSPSERPGGTPDPAETADSVKRRLVGTWRLVDYVITDAAGEVSRRKMAGGLMYDDQGRMSAQLLRFGSSGNAHRAAGTSVYVAYFGDYEIDTEGRRVIHHVKGSTRPMWIGDDLIRDYDFSEDRLKLSVREETGVTTELTWQRDV